MIRIAALALLLAAGPALAQTSLRQQVDAAASEANAIVSNMRGSILQLDAQVQQLQAQVAELTKERDALKAATKPKD